MASATSLDRMPPVDRLEDAPIAIMAGHLAEGLELDRETGPDGLRSIVLALDERRPIEVAAPRDLRRVAGLVVDVAVLGADPATGHPADELLGLDLDLERVVDPAAVLGQGPVERLGLGLGAREAVEDDAGARVGLGQPGEEHPDGDVVGDELAALHEAAGLQADRRARPDGGSEQVAGRDVGDGQSLGEDGRLGALAGARGAEQDQEGATRMKPS